MVQPQKLRGYFAIKAEKDSDLEIIWEALARRFDFVDEPERAMRRFDVRKQLEGKTLAVFEQSLRMLYREGWPKTDLKSPEADSLLRRKFVDGILDIELQKYLRLHAASDDFTTTVSKARHFVDANELSRTAKKPAIRTTSPSVNYQAVVDGVVKGLLQNQGRMAEVNAVQAPNSNANAGSKSKKAILRQRSPAPSDTSAGSSSRASFSGRTVRFRDQTNRQQSNQGYSSSGRSRWQGNQSPQGGNNSPRSRYDQRQPGRGTTRSPPPSSRFGWSPRQSGPQPTGQWMPGQRGPRFRPKAQSG